MDGLEQAFEIVFTAGFLLGYIVSGAVCICLADDRPECIKPK